MRRLVLVLSLLAFLIGCAKFSEGDCIQNTKDGYIWRITKVGITQYTTQGWVESKWGLPVAASFNTYDSVYVKIACPFSSQTVK